MTSQCRLAVGFELPDVFRKPYLLEGPDLIDLAVELIGFAGRVFGPLL
jgi:hypothetical protein